MYSALSLALSALDMTALSILEMLRTAPLLGGLLTLVEQKKMAAGLAACVGFAEVGCVAVHGKDHVTAFVHEDGIWIG
jgi:hypothetical protein